jgi:hypothetical protein
MADEHQCVDRRPLDMYDPPPGKDLGKGLVAKIRKQAGV